MAQKSVIAVVCSSLVSRVSLGLSPFEYEWITRPTCSISKSGDAAPVVVSSASNSSALVNCVGAGWEGRESISGVVQAVEGAAVVCVRRCWFTYDMRRGV